MRSHFNTKKNEPEGESGVEFESSLSLGRPEVKTKRKRKDAIKSEPKTCLECGWVSKSRLLHDRHLLATHGIQVAQVCQVCQETLADPKGKSLLELKVTTFLTDLQPPLMFVSFMSNFLFMCFYSIHCA